MRCSMDNRLARIFISCLMVAGIYGNEQPFNFSPNNGYNPGFQVDIFPRCWSEAGIPLAVALGDTFKWQYMCSATYYQLCKNELPAALTVVAQLTPDQRDFVMSYLLSWVNGGAPFLCDLGLDYVLGIMHSGGDTCLRKIVRSDILKCNGKMLALTSGLDYSTDYCSRMDKAMQCYIDAIIPCANDKLDNFLRDFFQSVVWDSPCSGSSPFARNGSAALHGLAHFILVAISATTTIFFST